MKGSCHCGRVTWTFDTPPESVTACNCTICRRYGALWAYGHIDHDVHTAGEAASYRRTADGTIDFQFCTNCGCVTHYVSASPGEDGRHWAAVNVRMSEPGPIADLPIEHFDGLDRFERLPRDSRCVLDMWS